MPAPTCLKFTILTDPESHTLDANCRRVTLVAIGNDLATITIGGDAVLLKENIPVIFEGRGLASEIWATGGTVDTVSVFEELGSGS